MGRREEAIRRLWSCLTRMGKLNEAILEGVKIFAHWDLRVGTQWEVINASKEEIFEEKPEPNVLDKLECSRFLRIECLEKKMDSMIALLLERIDTHHQQPTNLAKTMEPDSDKKNYSDSEKHSGSVSSAKQEGMLDTISHGLLLQRKALADGLKNIRKKFPDAGDELRKLLADDC
ncbi:hypothetical protein HF086_005815 [Spodoptera exigua]|uniref:Uncharacterized protein n=1 Tax=Spodoptera exigua TaxID=7107 RepID=A0A922M334_SPOEX|nr:hypothetical protein HF086_005815 [Spodoptera exigua]